MDMPGEEYKGGGIKISRNAAIFIACTFGSSLLLVGLLCGLLPADDPCNIQVPEPTEPPVEPVETTKALMTTERAEPTPSPGPTASAPQPWDSLRLPTDLIPSHYDIGLRIYIDDEQRFVGSISITMECKQSTHLLLLHSKELNIIPTSVRMLSVDEGWLLPKGPPRLFPANQYLIVEFDEMLTAGKSYIFTIAFYAPLEDGLVGLYRSSYQANGETRYLATTFFAPTDARKAFPCFDEPAMKVTFNLTLDHEDGYIALGNMPLLSSEPAPGEAGWTRSVFAKSVPMSTYLICFVVCDFVEKNTTTNNGVLLRVWAREDAKDSLDYALEKGAQVLDFFDGYFGTQFPLPKMDMIAIPDFAAGAMENWGLITYRESALLYTPGVSSSSNKQRVCAIVAHELAHQWFGNLVTLEWWDDTWLNEGFASYVEYLGTDAAEPDWGMVYMIAIPDFAAGAMENWGLITYRESALLYTPGVSSSSNKQRVCAIVAHELAHQWFGNLVTLEWWDDTWLNEGFASYVEYLGTADAEPDWGMTDQFVSADLQTALDADALITSRPIIVDVETPDDINQQFDTISYNKGASILRMLQNFLGEETFRKGLAAAVEDGKEDIKVEEIMRTWTEQMNYPSINVTRDYTTGFTLGQNRFLINPAANTKTHYDDLGYIWYVPLKYTTNAAPNFTDPTLHWLEPGMEQG
eukprot:XP_011671721.1 PREDICTED: aminopeptidase N [Strongylocentrotus purpuratus]